MKKTFVLDTSVLIHDPYAFNSFTESQVVLPITVIDELDKLKKLPNEAGKNARLAIRALDNLSQLGDISIGILTQENVLVKIDSNNYPNNFGDSLYGDTRILACAYNLSQQSDDVTLVSRDFNLRVRFRSMGLNAESYEKDNTEFSDLYKGMQIVENTYAAEDLLQDGVINPQLYGLKLFPNECVLFVDENGNELVYSKKTHIDKLKIIKPMYPWGISPKNKEQVFACNLIADPNIPLVTLTGKAGTGKTLITLATVLELVLHQQKYEKFVIYRPVQPMGKEIGHLPGPQPLDAKILTPSGWSTMGEMNIGDFVIGSDGLPKKVLNTFYKGTKDIYKVSFSDGSSTECCEDHLWYTSTRKEEYNKTGPKGSVKSLKEIKETLKVYKTKISNHKIPMIKPVQFSKKEHIIHPYILGVLLGDGTLAEKHAVYFTSGDKEIADNCSKLLPDNIMCKVKSKFKNEIYTYNFTMRVNENRKKRIDNIFNKAINSLGLRFHKSATKFIPKEYLFSSVEDRLAILQGLMDTDGFVSQDGTDVSFSTISNQLAEDFQFLVQSLGGKANITDKFSKTINLYSKVVSVSLPDNFVPFKLQRKIDRFKSRKNKLSRMICNVEFIGQKEAKCLLIDSEDHLYATDNLILTHNTLEEKLEPWFEAIMDNFEVLFSNSSGADRWRMSFDAIKRKDRIKFEALTYIRGRSIPNAVIFCDESQNISTEEIKTILTRSGENTKIILTGDIEQIDNTSLDAINNGLTYTIEKFKDSELAGHISLTKGERSKLATKASEIL